MPLELKLLEKIIKKYMKMKFSFIIIGIAVFSFLFSCKSKKQTISTSTSSSSSSETKTEIPSTKIDVTEGLNLGNKAPEIILPSPKGNFITLSSFKGKLVLIDFWASWCGPCRAENPTVVAAYKKYHTSKFKNGKGFEVLSVSLDQNAIAWEKAIEKDSLVWPYHGSDLRGWNNAVAQRYGVNSIPANVLVDGNGIIIAKNLRGELLEKTIELQLK